jgi:hypothetical protein
MAALSSSGRAFGNQPFAESGGSFGTFVLGIRSGGGIIPYPLAGAPFMTAAIVSVA